jgi:hypothetical protein
MGDNVTTIGEGGVAIPRSAEDAALLGSTVQDPAVAEQASAQGRRRAMFDTTADKVATVAEGIVDGFMLGFVHETGEAADLRREVNYGSAMLGQALGTATGLLVGGPVRGVARAGEAVGKVAAKGVLRQGEKAIVTRALEEAGAGAALTGAQSFGHALMDTVVEDRPFAAAAIADGLKLGGILGGVGGGLMGALGKVSTVTQGKVKAGLKSTDEALDAVEQVRGHYGEALHFHEKQLGAIKELRRAGKLADVSDDFIRVRQDAVLTARRAQAALKELDPKAAFSGTDTAAYKAFGKAWTKYRTAMSELDDVMRPHQAEMGAVAAREMDDLGATGVSQPTMDVSPSMVVDDTVQVSPSMVLDDGVALQQRRMAELDQHLDASIPASPEVGAQQVATVVGKMGDRAAVEQAAKRAFEPSTTDFLKANPKNIQGEIAQMFRKGSKADQVKAAKMEHGKTAVVDRKAVSEALEAPAPESVAQQLLDDWMAPPRVRPLMEAESRARAALEALYNKAGGRWDSARALGVLEADRIIPATDGIGSYFDSIFALNRATHLVSAESRGFATSLRAAAQEAVMGALGNRVARAVMGHVAAGPLGMAIGFTKFGGQLAAATGRLAQAVTDSVERFVSTTKVRSAVVAASNHPWAYSERGPIADPVERIQEIQFLAANPEGVRKRVREQAGDLALVAPDHIRALEDQAVQTVTHIAVRAPAIFFDKLGRPLMPPQGKMRQFFEYENAVNDLQGLLESLAKGSITQPQVDALKGPWASVHVKVAAGLLADPQMLQKFDRAKLRVVEMVTGVPLTGASDPMYLARQQAAWQALRAQQGPQGQKPQAFNINPDGAPTPSQANASGRAPGN